MVNQYINYLLPFVNIKIIQNDIFFLLNWILSLEVNHLSFFKAIFMNWLIMNFKYPIFCSGDEQYNCIWFKRRNETLVEYQIGRRPSTVPSFSLCDNIHFMQKTWITQASMIITQHSGIFSDIRINATCLIVGFVLFVDRIIL